jgi:hypothetical protein
MTPDPPAAGRQDLIAGTSPADGSETSHLAHYGLVPDPLRRASSIAVPALLLIGAATLLGYVFTASNRGGASGLASAITAVVTLLGTIWWVWRQQRSARMPVEEHVTRAVDDLAERVRTQWNREATDRRLAYPAPIPVRWRWTDLPVTGPIVEAVGGRAAGHRFAPLPGVTAVAGTTLLAAGSLVDLVTVYGGLDSGRMVILGSAGSGKTGAAIRLLLDALSRRAIHSERDRTRIPVLGAAARELQMVNRKEAADYLERCQVEPLPAPWKRLIDNLRQNGSSPVCQALDNPLMLTLVRDTYGHGEPVDELLDQERFPTRDTVEDHLLNRVVSTAYAARLGQPEPGCSAAEAQS